ncbi:MAG TPA: ApbE family lipoprotein [Candidatus Omnitrophica bacterium]|nr:ApbE family lipoprotein [Candidatus Omnitrophota bacterium]
MYKKIILYFLFTTAVFGCGKPLYRDSEFIMGTFVEVASTDPRAKAIVFDEFKRLQKAFDMFDEQSELSRLNKTGELTASEDLFFVLKKAREFYGLTEGAFDVTVAPVSILWKRAITRSELPVVEAIEDALYLVGFDGVYLDEDTRQVKLLKMGAMIDLGGIAKGYAVDKAITMLKKAQVSSAIVNAGGNIYCLGPNGRKAWRVGIQDPRVSKNLSARIELIDKAVATSGDYEQFFTFQNKRYSHIIDPKTGYPADSGVISATIVADDAMTADVLSTSIVVLGLQKGRRLLKNFPGVSGKVVDVQDKVHDL